MKNYVSTDSAAANTRRDFIKKMALAGVGAFAAPYISRAAENRDIFGKEAVRLGFIGTGLMGGGNMRYFKSYGQKVCAACDVDSSEATKKRIANYAEPDGPFFVDYREMLDKIKGKVDALVISTPDNSHFAIAMSALEHKIPIYLEKPMCHTVWQIRELTKKAQAAGVPTQMGNFVRSGEGVRIVKEWIAAGLIGEVKEVHMWTCRPLAGVNRRTEGFKTWPAPDPIPPTLDWDKWQNVSCPTETFSNLIVPLNWRRVYKYGSGALGDIGCHILDIPMYALELGYPSKITSRQRGGTTISVPMQDHVAYHFDTGIQGKPVTLNWYSGFLKPDKNGAYEAGYDTSFLPPLPEEFKKMNRGYKDLNPDGMFIVGTEGVLYSPSMHLLGKPTILPKARAAFLEGKNTQTIERVRENNHRMNFIEAVRGDVKKAQSDFSDVAVMTEVVQLGNIALRSGEDIFWDAKAMKCVGASAAANAFVNPPMRPGWY